MLLCLSTRVRSEVSLVAFCEAGVVDDASFEFGDPVGCGSEGLGCAADGEPLSGALPAQVCSESGIVSGFRSLITQHRGGSMAL